MEIKRDIYLERLKESRHNGLVKVVSGIRRVGKSYLLTKIFREYLLADGVEENHIIEIPLDMLDFEELLDKKKLYAHIKSKIVDSKMHYVFLDEIQLVKDFESVLNSLIHFSNVDVYVTGSNSKFLSSDIVTAFRGRSDEIRVYPLSFKEFMSVQDKSVSGAWKEFYTYGSLPLVLSMESEQKKSAYLKSLIQKGYIDDVIEHNKIRKSDSLEQLLECLGSAIGAFVNTRTLSNTFKSSSKMSLSDDTIKDYVSFFENAYLVQKANRYDVKGKKYIGSLCKYYFTDVGLRNALLNFRQIEEGHLMENILFNELRIKGFNVDVGMVEVNKKNSGGTYSRSQLEVDFVCNQMNARCYIQSALNVASDAKRKQEEKSLLSIKDSFKKIVIVKDDIKPKINDNGIITVGLFDFLLDNGGFSL